MLDIDNGATTRNLTATFDDVDSEQKADGTDESALDQAGLCRHDVEVRKDEDEHACILPCYSARRTWAKSVSAGYPRFRR